MADEDAPQAGGENDGQSPEHPARPWRTEGLPKGQPRRDGQAGRRLAALFLGMSVFFGLLTMQDRLSGPQAVPYTEFKAQVANQISGSVCPRKHDRRGAQETAPFPGQSDTATVSQGGKDQQAARIRSSRPNGRPLPPTICSVN